MQSCGRARRRESLPGRRISSDTRRPTAIRSKYGLEAAKSVLGHAKADTTLIYAERDLARAHEVMLEIG